MGGLIAGDMEDGIVSRRGRVLLMCGPPASGKDTLADEWISEGSIRPTWVVSADAVRSAISDSPVDHASEEWVWQNVRGVLRERTGRGLPSVLCSTNVDPDQMSDTASAIWAAGGDVAVLRLDLPDAVLFERNSCRPRIVPDDVMRRLIALFREECGVDQLGPRIQGPVFEHPGQALDWLREGATTSLQRAIPSKELGVDWTGVMVSPAVLARNTGVVLLHGLGSDFDEVGGIYRILADRLAVAGVPSIRVRLPIGGPDPVVCDGTTIERSVDLAVEAVEILKSRGNVSGVVVLGFSLGGTIAIEAADRVAASGVILWSVYSRLSREIRDLLEGIPAGGGEIDLGFRRIHADPRFMDGVDVAANSVDGLGAPRALVLVGAHDLPALESVPEHVARGESVEVRIVDSDHLLGSLTPSPSWSAVDTVDETVRWLVAHDERRSDD